MNVQTPEPIVNNAWRHLLCQNFELINGDSIHYSAGNQYDKLYESEGSDAALALLAWGYEADMRRLMVPLFDFTRKNLECHQAGFKLNNLCRYYWQTRDPAVVADLRPRWEKEAARLADSRTNEFGLCPKGQYCGDISTLVYSLTVNAKGWRALRDISTLLAETGNAAEAKRYGDNAAQFKKAILTAIDKSLSRQTTPPFIPVALYADEPVHDPITASRIGGYWNIVIGYVIEQRHLPARAASRRPGFPITRNSTAACAWACSAPAAATPSGPAPPASTLSTAPVTPSTRCAATTPSARWSASTACSPRASLPTPSSPAKAVPSPPPTRAAASSTARPTAPPTPISSPCSATSSSRTGTSTTTASPNTLRLLFATPKRWLEDGKTISVERAPTAFGPVSVRVAIPARAGRTHRRA